MEKTFKVMKSLSVVGLLLFMGSHAYAVNTIPLKPDAANAAPCIVYGSPYSVQMCAGLGLTRSSIVGISTQTTTLNPTNAYVSFLSTGGTVNLTAVPSISTINVMDGEFLMLYSTSTSNPVVVQDNGTLSGSLLELGAATRTITQLKRLFLQFDATLGKWVEVAYGNN